MKRRTLGLDEADETERVLRNLDPVDVAAVVANLRVDDPLRAALAAGLQMAQRERSWRDALRGASLDVHGAVPAGFWRDLAGREPFEEIRARRNRPVTPLRCCEPGCRTVLSVEHPLPVDLRVWCGSHRADEAVAA